jgi:hypothetical protein
MNTVSSPYCPPARVNTIRPERPVIAGVAAADIAEVGGTVDEPAVPKPAEESGDGGTEGAGLPQAATTLATPRTTSLPRETLRAGSFDFVG